MSGHIQPNNLGPDMAIWGKDSTSMPSKSRLACSQEELMRMAVLTTELGYGELFEKVFGEGWWHKVNPFLARFTYYFISNPS